MAAVMTRSPHPDALSSPSPSSPQLHQSPAKKSSFLSLRRDKRSASPFDSLPTSPIPGQSRIHDSSMSPPSIPIHNEPEPTSSRPIETRARSNSRRSAKSTASAHSPDVGREKEHHYHGKGKRQASEQETYQFPRIGQEKSMFNEGHSKSRPRTHSQSRNHDWEQPFPTGRHFNLSLLDSTSSVLSQFEDAPQTPVEELIFRDPVFSGPVVVAAPVAGVETMDALVDGMNHRYGSDDHFMGMGGISGRTKLSKSGHHPLYHPPLPTPPPGVVLGKALKHNTSPPSYESDEDDDKSRVSAPRRSEHNKRRPGVSRAASSHTVTAAPSHRSRPSSCRSVDTQDTVHSSSAPTKSVAPSISEIIRAYAPPSQQARSRKSSLNPDAGHITCEQPVPESSLQPSEVETDLISRSSVDTIAEEVQRTIRNQNKVSASPRTLQPARSFQRKSSIISDTTRGVSSPRSEGRPASSLFSYSTSSDQPQLPSADFSGLTKVPTNSPSQAIAQYLRSARLTTLLTLTRAPHASRDQPLTVSLSDLGSPHGFPLVVFLGLGCVRHIMGLYDEMAECLGVRLITIDRWGLGRTDIPRSKAARGIPEWASVVEEVLDRLHIDQCSIMAHSAGAPYALAFANRFPERIRGDVCLLAPWVGGGEGAGYKWLKYVPNGILKTAQAAEWKVQAWMIGKPPSFAFEGIGYDATASPAAPSTPDPSCAPSRKSSKSILSPSVPPAKPPLPEEPKPRLSMSSGTFSDYDDLHDFEGRFESRSMLERKSTSSDQGRRTAISQGAKRKPSRGFLGRLKGAAHPQSPPGESSQGCHVGAGKKLKALRSLGSLKSRSRQGTASGAPTQPPALPSSWLPPSTPGTDIGLGLDSLDWSDHMRRKSTSTPPSVVLAQAARNPSLTLDTNVDVPFTQRANGRRSMSLCVSERLAQTASPVSSPVPEATPAPASFQAQLGNALLAASHAESSRGTHRDLLQILNHDRQPWGFSYSAYPHTVCVWYGDRDERIAENAVRWMENTMGPDKCRVKVVKGADHALMYRSGTVVDVLEQVCEFWRDCDHY
ncbi:alpha/beta-hydrolase [Wolfiporia cocos MD-104 SS10]|uniref:Alpha/beta-hydrolase n=1 Tax=Wolfiporia cocos (strain MD-104) TaxID=742152 RepID=A0A2H3IUW4_WOLCO|nr:alpha/beta-hydrolase [Wolfiporia cocos MD-104 SS10]